MTRPIIKIPFTRTDWVLESIAAVAAVALLIVTTVGYLAMPQTIPIHFDASGNVDQYGTKESIWLIPLITLAGYVGLTIFERYPHKFNYMLEITKENAERQYRNMLYMMRILKVFIMILFLFLTNVITQIALGHVQSISRWFLPVIMIGLLGTLAIFIYRSYQLK